MLKPLVVYPLHSDRRNVPVMLNQYGIKFLRGPKDVSKWRTDSRKTMIEGNQKAILERKLIKNRRPSW